jgi:hypothetical protein
MTTFYCFGFETTPTWRAMSPYVYPPITWWSGYTPRYWVPFSSPLTSRKATVEVLNPASTRVSLILSHITTHGQSASLSWYQAPIWGLWTDFYDCQTIAGLLIWGALSDERTGLSFTIAVFASAVILRSESRGAHAHILLSQIWNSPNLEDQVPVFISPRNGVARLYPQALGKPPFKSKSKSCYDRRSVGQSVLE